MDPGKGKGQEYSRKEPVLFLFTWGPVHLIGCHFPQDGGQLDIEVCLCKNKATLVAETLLLSAPSWSLGSCPGFWAWSPAAHKTFFSRDRGHVALHSSTSRWCFSVFQPAACSPRERSQGEAREETQG